MNEISNYRDMKKQTLHQGENFFFNDNGASDQMLDHYSSIDLIAIFLSPLSQTRIPLELHVGSAKHWAMFRVASSTVYCCKFKAKFNYFIAQLFQPAKCVQMCI